MRPARKVSRPEGSLPELAHRTGRPYLFIDLRATRGDDEHWLDQPLVARPFGYAPMTARWADVADAIVWIERMEPALPAR